MSDNSGAENRGVKSRLRGTINRRCSRSGSDYFLNHEAAQRLEARLDLVRISPHLVVSSGMGNNDLPSRYKGSTQFVHIDFSEMRLSAQPRRGRLAEWMGKAQKRLCGDLSALPLKTGVADMVFSNLDLPFFRECGEVALVLSEAFRVLKPGGLFIFSSFGPDTLQAVAPRSENVIFRPASHLDMHDLGDMLVERGFGDPVMEVENLVVNYADPARLMDDLKVQGSCLFAPPDRKGLGGKKKWLQQISVANNETPSVGLDVKVEMVFGHAWKPLERLSPKGRRVIDIRS